MASLQNALKTVVTLLLVYFSTVFLLRRLLPILTNVFSQHFSIRTVSFRSIRGLEWKYSRRKGGKQQDVNVRVERVGYEFHRPRWDQEITSWLTLVVEDVRVVVRDSVTPAAESPGPSSPSSPTSPSSPSSPFPPPTPLSTDEPRYPSTLSPSPTSPRSPTNLLSPCSSLSPSRHSSGSYFVKPVAPSWRSRLSTRLKRSARTLAERWVRSALNCLPDLAKVVDLEVISPVVVRMIAEGGADDFGATQSVGLEVKVPGNLRLHSNIELSTPPSAQRRFSTDPISPVLGSGSQLWAPMARRRASRFRSSASTILERGLGRAAGKGSLILEFAGEGGLEVRALDGPEFHQGLRRVSSGFAWFNGKDSKQTDGVPKRNSSFPSLSTIFAHSTSSSSGTGSPRSADLQIPLLLLSGPIKLEVGHAFGPGVSLLGSNAVKLEVGLKGELALDGNGLERLDQQRKVVSRTNSPSTSGPTTRKPPGGPSKLIQALGHVHLHAKKLSCSYLAEVPRSESSSSSGHLPLEVALLDMSLHGQDSTPDISQVHLDWLGSSTSNIAHSLRASAGSLQLSVLSPESRGDRPSRLPSVLCLQKPFLDILWAPGCCSLMEEGLLAVQADLKSLELGLHVADVQLLQRVVLRQSSFAVDDASSASPPPEEASSTSIAVRYLPRVLFSSSLGSCKVELAAPSTDKEDNLLSFDCSGGQLNVDMEAKDVVQIPKRHSKRTAPSKIWPEDFSVDAEQNFAYNVRSRATFQPFKLHLQVSSSEDPSSPATDVAPAIIKSELSELKANAVVPGNAVVTSSSTAGNKVVFDEKRILRPASSLGRVHAAIGNVTVEIWEPELVERLSTVIAAISALRHSPKATSQPTDLPSSSTPDGQSAPDRLLARLPSGLTLYVCIAQLDVLVAAADPNPECTQKPLRGLWFRTRIVAQYCQVTKHHASQHPVRTAASRTALHLEEDIIVQSVSYTNQNVDLDSKTALVSVVAHESGVRPVFNARRFRTEGPDATGEFKAFSDMFPTRAPMPEATASLVGWDYQDKRPKKEEPWTSQVKSDPFSLSAAERASSPLRIPTLDMRIVLRQTPSQPSNHLITVTLPLLDARLDLSHAWATLVALEGLKKLRGRSNKSSKAPTPSGPSLLSHFDVQLNAHLFHIDLELPLGERLFVRLRKLSGSLHDQTPVLAVDSILAYVPNVRTPALWDELLFLKTLKIQLHREKLSTVDISLKTARLRIPWNFKLSQLILNLNVTVKSLKHLFALFESSDFSLVVQPKVEGPKRLPNIIFHCASLCFEAQDDPMETRLNLIWRVGMAEQSARLEREEAFEAKVAAIAKAEGREQGPESSSPLSTSSRWKFGGRHTVDVENARGRLALFNSANYVRRFRNALQEHARKESTHLRQVQVHSKHDSRLPIDVTLDHRCSPMFRMTFFGIRVNVSPPSFHLKDLPDFLHDVGKGLPKTTEFSLLVPLHLSWTMDTARVILRDYPVPLFNLPAISLSDKSTAKAIEFESDLVIGEEMAGSDSFFWIPTAVIPANLGQEGAAAFELKVAKTIMPVKTYAQPTIKFNTSQVTSWGWGSSMQPGIQDMMKVFETLTHPPRDPSPRIGFWDKLRLVFHWSLEMTFAGPVHIHAKGSRNPYNIVDHGAGFVLAWSGSPKMTINKPNPQRELVQIEADNLYFAIPDFRGLLDHRATGYDDGKGRDPNQEEEKDAQSVDPTVLYTKICAKFTNGARAGWGFVLERTCTDGDCNSCEGPNLQRQCRKFDFSPHWDVVLRTPESFKEQHVDPKDIDSYHGFRSDYIHFSMSIDAPIDRECPREHGAPAGYNSFHFSPKGFAHFFAWWGLFGGNMGLPIRQGPLFPNSPPPSKKFGKSLATIKYRFEIAPLYISHLYANDSKADWEEGIGTFLGIKVKLAKFRADLHQREQERTVTNEKLQRTKKIPHKPFYAADLVLDDIDLRAMSVLCREPEKAAVQVPPIEIQDVPTFSGPTALPDSHWRDRDDLIETDYTPSDKKPSIELHQIGVCPRFTFKKRPQSAPLRRPSVDGQDAEAPPLEETSKFGHEPTHLCHLNQFKDPLQLQVDLARQRLEEVEATLEKLRCGRAKKTDAEVDGIPIDNDTPADRSLLKKIVLLQDHVNDLTKELRTCSAHLHRSELDEKAIFQDNKVTTEESSGDDPGRPRQGLDQKTAESWQNFDNVFQAHYPHITWSNEIRNIVLKYYYHSRARRGFEYHMSALAVKFIREMTLQRTTKPASAPNHHFHPAAASPSQPKKSSKFDTGRQKGSAIATGFLNMLSGDQPEVAVPEPQPTKRSFVHQENGAPPVPDPWEGLSDGLQIQQNHCFILVKPQIALRSSVDDDSVVIIAAMSTNLMMYGVLDEQDLDDPVNSRVMRRSYMTMTAMQAFYPADRSEEGNGFVPLEILLDIRSQTDDFERIIPQTSASLQYDKFNQLRLRNSARSKRESLSLFSNDTHLGNNMDLAVVDIPRLAVTSDSAQFASLYNIVTNLLLYQDSVQRERNKRLEDFTYSFDHSNLSAATDLVLNLQHRIRVNERMQTNLRADTDRRRLERSAELASLSAEKHQLSDELDLIFLAIASAQDPRDKTDATQASAFRVEVTSSEISWNMLTSDKRLLAKMALKHSVFSHVSQKDSSLINTITVKDLQALNGQQDALFPEMLSRYERQGSTRSQLQRQAFLYLKFHLLAPVGGISIVQSFILTLHPVRVQVERKTASAIHDYFFQEFKPKPDDPKSGKKAVAEAAYDHPQPPLNRPSEDFYKSEDPNSSLSTAPAPPKRSFSSQNLNIAGRARSNTALSVSGQDDGTPSGHATPRLKRSKSNVSLKGQVEKSQAAEMRSRASHNRTFVLIEVESTTFVLSYKGDRAKNLTDLHDFKFSTPAFEFRNKTWAFEDLVEELKSQLLKAAWSQRGSLVSQIFTKTGRKASAALGYQQDSGSNTSVDQPSHSTSRLPRMTTLKTPTSSVSPAPGSTDSLVSMSSVSSGRKHDSLLKRSLHLTKSNQSLSDRSFASSGDLSPVSDGPYIIVSQDNESRSPSSSFTSISPVYDSPTSLESDQAKKDALLGRSLRP